MQLSSPEKSMPISAYVLRTLECCLALKIMSTEFERQTGPEAFSITKNSRHPLEQKIVVSYERSSPDC